MLILGLTTSSAWGSVCLMDESGLKAEKVSKDPKAHTEFLNSALESLLRDANRSFSQIQGVALDLGPGSFTGVRLAVNVAKTLSFSLNIPIFTTNSLAVISHQINQPVLVAINAHKNLVYTACFENSQSFLEPKALSLELAAQTAIAKFGSSEAKPLLVLGDGFSIYESTLSPQTRKALSWTSTENNYPQASRLVQMALQAPKSSWTHDWNSIIPLYIRASEAEESLKQ